MTQEGSPSYEKQWEDLHRRRLTAMCVFAGFIPFFVLAITVVERLVPPSASQDTVLALMGVYAVVFFVTGNRWSSFPCPRCGKPFFKPNTWSINQLLTR
jgi:hypothetical protein